jgi:hypothetical protein
VASSLSTRLINSNATSGLRRGKKFAPENKKIVQKTNHNRKQINRKKLLKFCDGTVKVHSPNFANILSKLLPSLNSETRSSSFEEHETNERER